MSIAWDRNNSWGFVWAGYKTSISHALGVGLTHSLSGSFRKVLIHIEIYIFLVTVLLLF